MTRGRQRKKKRQQALKQEQQITPEDSESSRGIGLSEPILQDPHRVYEDTRIASKAVRGRWDIPSEKRVVLVDRLFGIVEKKSNVVLTKSGLFNSESDADSNAIAASKVLVAMVGQDQADDHLEVKVSQPKVGTQVNVNVGVQVNQAVQTAVGTEPEYLDWVRQRELAEGGNAHVVGANGFAAKVPDSAPRLGVGPGSNGHH